MKPMPPTYRRLTLTWVLLMGLTLASMGAGRVLGAGGEALGGASVAILLAVTVFKARQVLFEYLNLRVSSLGWRVLFMAYLALVSAVVFGGYIVAGGLD